MRRAATIVTAALLGLGVFVATQGAGIAAGAVLHPARSNARVPTPAGCEDLRLAGAGIQLAAWQCRTDEDPRGTIVYLHGIADNRASGAGVVERYRRRGFDVIAYDNRAHGDSGGDVCTYGHYEKEDLKRVIDIVRTRPILLIGSSLGAAVALQTAAEDARVSGVVAAEVFSDLRTVVRERAPFFVPNRMIAKALELAGQRGRFDVEAVSPTAAARRIRVPVLLIHGARDTDTRPEHSQRVYDALAGPKRLILVNGAGHNRSLSSGAIWDEIDQWIEDVIRNRSAES
jgi:pimeloyl-ACP methyl ester carboxylesterase